MTIAQATTFDPPISQPGRVTSCTNPSPSGSPKTMSCWQREVSDLWPNNAYDVAALTAARDAAQTAFRNATDRNIDDPSLINLALVAAAKNALDAAQAALDAAGVAQECNNAQGMGQVGGGAPCTIIANPTCVAWAVANGKQGNGQCVW